MQTVNDIRRRATRDLQRRIFRSGIFRLQRMKEVAMSLARKYASGLSPEKLLALARHDTWLKSGRGTRSPYPGEKTDRIAEELLCYFQSELCIVVDTFWEERTSVEFITKRSSVELKGFFNGERPGRKGTSEGPHSNAHNRPQAPYV